MKQKLIWNRRIARLASQDRAGPDRIASAQGTDRPPARRTARAARYRARRASTDRAAPLGPIIRYMSRIVCIVSWPNRMSCPRWMYWSDPAHARADVTRVHSPTVNRTHTTRKPAWMTYIVAGLVMWYQIEK